MQCIRVVGIGRARRRDDHAAKAFFLLSVKIPPCPLSPCSHAVIDKAGQAGTPPGNNSAKARYKTQDGPGRGKGKTNKLCKRKGGENTLPRALSLSLTLTPFLPFSPSLSLASLLLFSSGWVDREGSTQRKQGSEERERGELWASNK